MAKNFTLTLKMTTYVVILSTLILVEMVTEQTPILLHPDSAHDSSSKMRSQYTARRLFRDNSKDSVQIAPIGKKGGRKRVHKSRPLAWVDRIFNSSAHEVPTGPNPISNR